MSDKWNDKLRRQMAEYTETPPEGLWEGIEEGLQKRRAAAFPWWWALAGAAAAVLAVLLLWRPGAVEPQLATDAVAEAVPDSREDAVVPTVSATPQTVNNINVLHSSLPSEPPELAEPAPAEPELAEPVPSEPVPSEPDDVESVIIPKEAERPAADEERQAGVQNPVQKMQYPAERRDAPARLVTISLIAGGVPGGGTSSTYTSYAMSTVRSAAASPTKKAPVALLSRNKPTENDVRHSIAFRAGAMFSIPVGRHWDVETGLQLSNLLTRTTSTTGNMSTVTSRTLSYVGLPVYAVYTPFRFGNGAVYASAGPMLEYGFRSSGTIDNYISDSNVGSESFNTRISDLVWSLNLNAGVQWLIGGVGGLFLQPGLSWYIPGQNKEETFYTEHPLSFALSAGFRFTF